MLRLVLVFSIIFSLFTQPIQAEQNIFAAIEIGDLEELEHLIDLGFDVNQINEEGISPLMKAVSVNDIEMVISLLDSGADVNFRIAGLKEGSSIVKTAIKYSDTEILETLLKYGGDLDGGLNALAYINRQDKGSDEIARILLENGVFLDEGYYFYDLFNDRLIVDSFPCILEDISSAFNSKHCTGIAAVISEYLNTYSIDNFKYGTLAFAAAMSGGPRIQAFIDAGFNPNEKIWRTEGNSVFEAKITNPLEIALLKGNLAAVASLLDNGAKLDYVHIDILKLASLDDGLATILQGYGLNTESLKTWYLSTHQECQEPATSAATVSFILDDGERRDKEIISTIFEPRNVQGNIAVVAGFMGKRQYMDFREISELEAKGWEVSSHSYYHEDLASLTTDGLELELIDSQKELRSYGFNVKTIVYPYGNYNDLVENITRQSYDAAFTGGYYLNSVYSNPYALGRYNINNNQSYNFYKNLVNRADREGKWLVFALHSSYDLGWEQRQNLDQLLDYICQQGIEILPTSQALAKIGLN